MITRENGLGYLLKDGLDNSFNKEIENNYYIENVYSSNLDFLRVVFLSLCAEGLLTQKELQYTFIYNVDGCRSEDGYDKEECINDLLKLTVFSSRGITTVDEAILYLNQFQTHTFIINHPEIVFVRGFFSEHGIFIYKSDDSGKMFINEYVIAQTAPSHNENYIKQINNEFNIEVDIERESEKKYIYMLDLKKDYSNDYWNEAVRVGEVGDSVLDIYSPEGIHIYLTDYISHISIYNLLRKRIMSTFIGKVVLYTDKEIFLQNDNVLYRIYSSNIDKIYEMPRFTKAIRSDYWIEERIKIIPVIRCFMLPYKITYEGYYMEDDERLSDYVRNCFIKIEAEANQVDVVSLIGNSGYENTNHHSYSNCTINSILTYFDSVKEIDSSFYYKTITFQNLIRLLGEYYNRDTDISSVLMRLRHDNILRDEDYWQEIIPKVEGLYDGGDDIELSERDIISMDSSGLIDYNHRKFLTTEYMERLFEMHKNGNLKRYLNELEEG